MYNEKRMFFLGKKTTTVYFNELTKGDLVEGQNEYFVHIYVKIKFISVGKDYQIMLCRNVCSTHFTYTVQAL